METLPQRVKIDTAEYNEAGDTVSWTVTLVNGKKADLVWRREDFGPTFKINALIPVPLVKEFCNSMIGKEINLIIEPKPPKPVSDNIDFSATAERVAELVDGLGKRPQAK